MWSFFPYFFIVLTFFSKEFFICNEEFLVGFLFMCVTAFFFKNLETEVISLHLAEESRWGQRISAAFFSFFEKKEKGLALLKIIETMHTFVRLFLDFSSENKYILNTATRIDSTSKKIYSLLTESIFFLNFLFEKRAKIFFSKNLFFY